MLGGGAGHIADMIARMRANKALQNRRKFRKKSKLNTPSKNQTKLKFKKISSVELNHFREKYEKQKRRGVLTFILLSVVFILTVFTLYKLLRG